MDRLVWEAEFRVQDDGENPKKIAGHAAVFEKLSNPMYGFKEKVRAGAFAETIKKDDIRALFNHDANYVLGRTKANTLSLAEDQRGLAFEVEPPDTQWARDLMVSINRKDISTASFGFRTNVDEWDHSDPKLSIRTLIDVQLFDVSPVTFAAYPQTDVKLRSDLQQAGIDVDYLTAIMFRSSNKMPITTGDLEFVAKTIKALEEIRAEEAAGGGDNQEEGRRRLEFYKRSLELQIKQF